MKTCLQRLLACTLLCACLTGVLAPSAAAASTAFSDVPASHWAADSIARSVELGLFQGETKTTFGLGHSMTRAAFVVVLCRLFGWEMQTPAEGTYTDVQDPSAWYFSAVETAYANGAITRQTERFRPADAITREEIAVMLVRALGYGTIAGLAQELPMPFRDVTSNVGYISMAYELGIITGTSATTFSPDQTATREQAAVMLMRLYERYNAPVPGRIGITISGEGLEGYDVVAIPAARLVYNGQAQVSIGMDSQVTAPIQTAARAAGAEVLLYVTGSANTLKGSVQSAAEDVAAAVQDGGYDGVFLDIPKLSYDQRKTLTTLVKELDTLLGDKLLYVMAEAPVWDGKAYEGYDYAALGAAADRLVLRVAAYEQSAENFPISALEPLEEVYYALAELKGTVPGEKTSLLLTTTGLAWTDGKRAGSLDAQEITALLADSKTEAYYSSRYACAYLANTGKDGRETAVWYLDGAAAAERVRLAGFFDVDQVCLSDLTSVSADLLSGLDGK